MGIPTVTSLGSNKLPEGICAPVSANVTYSIAFVTPVPPGSLELVYDWGDGTPPEVFPLAIGERSYNATRAHSYPPESNCEYYVSIGIRYNGQMCTSTTQLQKISSWRTDAFNGGNVSLISPTTKTQEHLVCEGEPIAVTFEDNTNWNCNNEYAEKGVDPIESPNIQNRWQQLVYNTPVAGRKIPNVSVDGVVVTGPDGSDVRMNYHDHRGVHYMSAPVLVDDSRRRSSLEIAAPGGFGDGFAKAGDEFAITLRYWNFCNPYDDPEIPGPPADELNGDHPPVEKRAIIRVLAPPPSLKGTDQTVCLGTTPQPFTVTGLGQGNIVNWYSYVEGSDVPGKLIVSGKSSSLAITSHPGWQNNSTSGVFRVWATQRTNSQGVANCESEKVLITRTIREGLAIPEPDPSITTEMCNGGLFTIRLPGLLTEAVGGKTKYTWTGSSGLSLVSSTEDEATFSANVSDFGVSSFLDGTVTVSRQYETAPVCVVSKKFNIRVYRAPVGGVLSGPGEVCERSDVGQIAVSGIIGVIKRWEMKKDNGVFHLYDGAASENAIHPGKLPPGIYSFRAVVGNGPCNEVFSNEQSVKVFSDPGTAKAGADQFICHALQSAALNASFSESGKSLWSYVSSVPAGLPMPSFVADDPNTTVAIAPENAGAYTLRWSVTNGPCLTFDDVVVDFGTNPTEPNAGADKSVCGPTTILSANEPQKGIGTWSVVSGPNGCIGDACGISIESPASPGSSVALSGSSFGFGAYRLRWTITSGGNNCFLKSDDVMITFEEPVSVEASNITDICLDLHQLTAIPLWGVALGNFSSAEWVNLSGTGKITSPSQVPMDGRVSVQALYEPTVEDYNSGMPITLKLTAVAANESCSAVEKIITLEFERKPIPYAGMDLNNVCGSDARLQAGPLLHGATGKWAATSPAITFDDASDPGTTVRNLPVGMTTLTWSAISKNGNCVSAPATLTLTRAAAPDVKNIEAMECAINEASTNILLTGYEDQVTSLPMSEREVVWFKDDENGEAIGDPSSLQLNVRDGERYVARVVALATGCSAIASVTVKVRSVPPIMNAVITRCEEVAGSKIASGIDLNTPEFYGAVTSTTNADVRWYASESDARAGRFAITAPLIVEGKKDFFAMVTYRGQPYCSSIARLTIVVNSQPATSEILGRESVCQGTSSPLLNNLPMQVYQVTPIPGAKYYWEIPDDPRSQFVLFGGGGQNDFFVLLQFPNVYTGKIRVRAELNGCSGPVIEKEIAVSASPAKPFIEGTSIVCENSPHVSFRVTPNNYPASRYNWEVRKASDNSPGGAYIMEGQLTGNVLVNFAEEDVVLSVRESSADCVSPVATKLIKVTDPPKASLIIEQEVTCFLESNGIIRTEVSGGAAPFSAFEILETGAKDGDGDGIFSNLAAGSYTVRLQDANGCVAVTPVQVLKQPHAVTPDFEIIELSEACDGGEFLFTWTPEPDIDYRWEWGDGSSTQLKASDLPVGKVELKHTFPALFPSKPTSYPVHLFAGRPGCLERAVSKPVSIPPPLRLNILAGDTLICSGETVTFYNNSTGIREGRWYSRVVGNAKLDYQNASTGKSATMTFVNDTSADPLVYEVVYQAENEYGCSAEYRRLISVYQSKEAFFNVDSVYGFDGNAAKVTVSYEHDATVPDALDLIWNYGEQGFFKGPNGSSTFDITYRSPGKKRITFHLLNLVAQKAGKVCQSDFTQEIVIPVNQLKADFTASPLASCHPVVVKVENRSSGGDTFLWKLYREGTLVSSSNLRQPEFQIARAGVYDLRLSLSVAGTDQKAEAELKGLKVFDVPNAAFELRSDAIYVPDTPIEVINFSKGANFYQWLFGDRGTSDLFEPSHAYEKQGRYRVLLIAGVDHGMVDIHGTGVADHRVVCYDSAARDVVALNGGNIQIPNAFTPDTNGPNGGRLRQDGFNDIFLPVVSGVTEFHMQIYDRWGTLIFESREAGIGWDGYDRHDRLLPAGVYVYKIFVRTSEGERVTRIGDVSLIL